MAHEIEGNRAIFSKIGGWHGMGITIPEGIENTRQALQVIHPEELIEQQIAAVTDGGIVLRDNNGNPILIEDKKAIFRVGEDEHGNITTKYLCTNNATYQTVHPWEAMQSFDPMIEDGLIDLETGLILRDGRQLVILGRVKGAETEIVKGDRIDPYFLFYTSFDGSLRLGCQLTPIRVVCANTLAMAMGITGFSTRHTKNVIARYHAARDTVAVAIRDFQETAELYRFLGETKVTRKAQETYIRRVIELDVARKARGEKKKTAQAQSDDAELSARTEGKIADLQALLDTQLGLELVPAARGTAWQAYNAMTHHITHDAGTSDDTRIAGQWFGDGADLNRIAIEQALNLAGGQFDA